MRKLVEIFCDVDDREPLPELCTTMKGKLYGDKGHTALYMGLC